MSLLAVTSSTAMLLVWLLPIKVCLATNWNEPGVPGKKGIGARIVNGNDADPCEWRWQVHFAGSCGGTLIAPSWIISAAHCALLRYGTVTVGDYNKESDNDNPGKVKKFNVKQWINHPKYDKVSMVHDLALVEIDGAVETNECVGFAKLPTSSLAPGKKCWITGWGTLQFKGSQPAILQEAAVMTTSNQECRWAYGHQLSDDMLCAQGKTDNGKIVDGCQGDSGGPLVCEEDGKWVIHGATSWGNECALEEYPGIWSRVYEHLDFLYEHLPTTTTTTTTTTATTMAASPTSPPQQTESWLSRLPLPEHWLLVVISVAVGLVLLALLYCCCCRRRTGKEGRAPQPPGVKGQVQMHAVAVEKE